MQNLNGTYTWHYINNEDKIEGVYGGVQYLVCVEGTNGKASTWQMQLTYWHEKGDHLVVRDSDGAPHDFEIKKSGFYVVDEIKGKRIYRVLGVRYWADIMEPEVDPDDVLTIL